MPKLVPVKNDEIARLCNQLKVPGGFHRIILKQLANQFALCRLIDEPHQNSVAGPLIIGCVVVKPYMVPGLRIIVQRAGMGVVLRA